MNTRRFTTGLLVAVVAIVPVMADDLYPVPVIPQAQEFGPTAPVAPMPVDAHVMPPMQPGTIVEGPIHYDHAPIPLFTRVKYVDKREAHPCAITKIIKVNNPCISRKARKLSCTEDCVYIEICVPPCGCENVKCRRHGDRVRYDYGKYKVDVRVKNGFIVVDYQK